MTFNSGCSESASINNFGCQQPPPAPLPDIPATAVLFAFEEGGLFGVSSVTTIDEALNEFNQYLTCFPQSVCDVAQAGDILYHDGTNFTLESFADLTEVALNELLPTPGTFLLNDAGVVGPANFCDEVEDCTKAAIAVNGNVLTLANNNLVSRPIVGFIADYIEALLPNNGDIIINSGGTVGASNLCDEVFVCLSNNLGAGQILLGGAPGGIALLCDEVEECLGALLDNGDVLLGTPLGVAPTNLCTAVESCLGIIYNTSAGEFLYDAGSGLVPTDFCGAVLACVDAQLLTGNNTYYGTDAAGNVGELPFCESVAACINAQPVLITGILDPGDTFLGGATGGTTNFCGAVADCIAAAPSMIFSLLGPGEIFLGGVPGGIALLCEEVEICLGLDTAVAGDLFTITSAGAQDFRSFIAHMNDIYPQTTCYSFMSYNLAAGTWGFGSGPRPLPPTPAALIPAMPPALAQGTWEYNKETRCAEWVCSPRQKDIIIQVPGDFPTPQDAVNWLRAKTVDNVIINVAAGTFPPVDVSSVNGIMTIQGAGGTSTNIQGIRNSSTTMTLFVRDLSANGSVTDGFTSDGGPMLLTNVFASGNAQNGLNVVRGGNVIIQGNSNFSGNALTNISVTVGSTIQAITSLPMTINDAGQSGLVVSDASHASFNDLNSVSNNGANGIFVGDSSSISTGSSSDILVGGNGGNGVTIDNNSRMTAGAPMFTNLNGGEGISITRSSNLTNYNQITSDSNTRNGFFVSQSTVFANSTRAFTNGQFGYYVYDRSSFVTLSGNISANANASTNIVVEDQAHLRSGAQILTTNSVLGDGISVTNNSLAHANTDLYSAGNTRDGARVLNNSTLLTDGTMPIVNNLANGVLLGGDSLVKSTGQANIAGNAADGIYAVSSSIEFFNATTTIGNNLANGVVLVNSKYNGVIQTVGNAGNGIWAIGGSSVYAPSASSVSNGNGGTGVIATSNSVVNIQGGGAVANGTNYGSPINVQNASAGIILV